MRVNRFTRARRGTREETSYYKVIKRCSKPAGTTFFSLYLCRRYGPRSKIKSVGLGHCFITVETSLKSLSPQVTHDNDLFSLHTYGPRPRVHEARLSICYPVTLSEPNGRQRLKPLVYGLGQSCNQLDYFMGDVFYQ